MHEEMNKMKIMTKYHGEMDVDENDLWHFNKGIPGFLEEKQFLLYPLADQDVFSILQSVVHSEIAFIVANPFAFFKDYEFNLDENVLATLDIGNENEVCPLVILTLEDTLENSTANLQAPIILNMKNHHAKQIILHETDYQTKHPLSLKAEQG